MFPTRHRRKQPSWIRACPGVTDEVRDVICVTPVPAGIRKPGAALRHHARDCADGGRMTGIRHRLMQMVQVVAAAGVLACSTAMATDAASPAQDLVKQVTSSIIEELD